MTALAISLAYLGTLMFGAWFLARRDAYREDVIDRLTALSARVGALESRTRAWDDAAAYAEAQNIAKGLRR